MDQQATAAETPVKAKTRVLLIEDNPADARLVEIFLKESNLLDCDITSVDELGKGLQALEELEFDAILLDLTLPDSQGFNTIKTVIEEFPEYTIIVMTGLEDETIALNSVKAGAQDFIVKGQFDSTLLSRTISYAIERHQLTKQLEGYARAIKKNEQRLLEAQKMARIGNWELDVVTNRMFWSDEVYRILGFLDQSVDPSLTKYLEFVAPEDVDRVSSEIRRTMEKGARYNIEYRLNLPDGNTKVVANQGQIQMSQKTGSIVLVGTIQDITSFRGGDGDGTGGPAVMLDQARSLVGELLESSVSDAQRQKLEKLNALIVRLAD